MARNIFQIDQGKLWLAPVGQADDPSWIAPGGGDVESVTEADYMAGGVDASCQIQAGSITASPNLETQTVDPTFCEPGEDVPVPRATSYTLEGTALQDPNVRGGVNQFLFTHDTEEIYFMLGLNGVDPPKSIGRARAVAGTEGGPARTPLTFDISLPVIGKPQRLYGTATDSEAVPPTGGVTAPARSSASPGDVFAADPDITASDATNAAKLAGEGFIADPQTDWNAGEQITVGPYAFHWNGTAWTAGQHP